MKPITCWSVTVNGELHRCGRYEIAPAFFTSHKAALMYAKDLHREGTRVEVVRVEIREVATL